SETLRSEQSRPSEHCVQRSAQFVRHHREELILGGISGLKPRGYFGVLSRPIMFAQDGLRRHVEQFAMVHQTLRRHRRVLACQIPQMSGWNLRLTGQSLENNENPEILGMSSMAGEYAMSSLVDNILLLNWVELGDEFRLALTVAKMRGNPTNRVTRECDIVDGQGFQVLARDVPPAALPSRLATASCPGHRNVIVFL